MYSSAITARANASMTSNQQFAELKSHLLQLISQDFLAFGVLPAADLAIVFFSALVQRDHALGGQVLRRDRNLEAL